MAAFTEILTRWVPLTSAHAEEGVETQRLERGPTDMVLVWAILMLCGIGLVGIYTGSALEQFRTTHGASDLGSVFDQTLWLLLGIVAATFVSRIDYRVWGRRRYLIVVASFVLLALVHIPGLGVTLNGSTRWIGAFGKTFQPVEAAKVGACIYFAANIAAKQHSLNGPLEFVGNLVIGAIFALLLMSQPDLGSTVLIGCLMLMLLFLGGVHWGWLAAIGSIGVAGLAGAVFTSRYGYRADRLAAWMDPWANQSEAGYQLVSSYTALASGGELGTGFGYGRGWLGYLPEMQNDFIAAGIGEEFGLLGIGALLVLYVIVLWRGVLIADRARDRFGYLLALGLTGMILLQAGINFAVVTGLAPTKGITLPFVSSGGSSLVFMFVAIGILLNIGQNNPDLVREAADRRRMRRIEQLQRLQRDRVRKHRREAVARNTTAGRTGGFRAP